MAAVASVEPLASLVSDRRHLNAEGAYHELLDLQRRGIQLGLDRVRQALAALDNPHLRAPWVVVAGTNGKGSTSAFLASILQAGGYRVGLYTSPHLFHPRERIRVQGKAIPERDFAALAADVLEIVREEDIPLTFFEAMTCMAFRWFIDQEVDVGVLEVGLGGRLDAVNVVHPTATVLTSLALDHCEILGHDIASIAREKAGILRPRVPLAAAIADDVFRDEIGPICLRDHIPVIKLGRDALHSWSFGLFSYRGPRFNLHDVSLSLPGRFQAANAALAVAAAEHLTSRGFSLSADSVRRGLTSTEWRGRFEVLADVPPLVVDVAHNPAGMRALVDSLQERFGARRYHVCIGVRPDKDLAAILGVLAPITDTLAIAGGSDEDGLRDPASLSAELVGAFPKIERHADLEEAVARARKAHAAGLPTLITGSHRLVGAALAAS